MNKNIQQKIEQAIKEKESELQTLNGEVARLFKIKHFNPKLEYAYDKASEKSRDCYIQIQTYKEILQWIGNESEDEEKENK